MQFNSIKFKFEEIILEKTQVENQVELDLNMYFSCLD